MAIVAKNLHFLAAKLFWHRSQQDFFVENSPRRTHVAHRRVAGGARVAAMCKVALKTLSMNSVATTQNLWCFERVKEKLATDGAVLLHRVRHAHMVVAQLGGVARAACVAMEKVVSAACEDIVV